MSGLSRRGFMKAVAGGAIAHSAAGGKLLSSSHVLANASESEASQKPTSFDSPVQTGGGAAPSENLALLAEASASPESEGKGTFHGAVGNANDGNVNTFWGSTSPLGPDAWLVLTWPGPVTFHEVVIRQNLRRFSWDDAYELNQLTLQIRHNGRWQTLRTLGDGAQPLPSVILVQTADAQTTDALRLVGFKGTPNIYEIEVYKGPSAPVINMAGDVRGNILGIVTDAWGAAGMPGVEVRLSGRNAGHAWTASGLTDSHGMFSVSAPTGLTGELGALAQVSGFEIEKKIDAGDLPLALTPLDAAEKGLSLNGDWKFAPDPPIDFFRPEFDDSGWGTISVPSHWILQGFQSEGGVGGYRRLIEIPPRWMDRRIKVRFEGVYSGAEVWLNGRRVGSHEGGFTPFEVNVSEAAVSGRNLLAVRVTEHTRSRSLDSMSLYADFDLSGIMRVAYIYSVPAVHVERLHVATLFDSSFRNATLKIDLKLVNQSDREVRHGTLRWSLESPDKATVTPPLRPLKFSLEPWGQLEEVIEIPIRNPKMWEAEHPQLYRLTAQLYEDQREIESVTRQVGFRQVDIRGTQLLINGVPVKLRGVCHHDSHPVLGRAVTPEITRQDLQLIKEANLDALRTSHYPAVEELYEGADELGIYVEAEAPFCMVGGDQSCDLRLAPLVVQHGAELLERDRSHPSVIIWSMANESVWAPVFDRLHEYVKQVDPTRPTSAATSKDLDIATRHNPMTAELIRQSSSRKTPLLWDESLCIFQGIFRDGLELWRDPGDRDYWIAPLVSIWDEMLASQVVQGSMIWAWVDDIFQVPGRGSEIGHTRGVNTHGVDQVYCSRDKGLVGDAPWGIVDGWRRKKPEFWHAKKLHSPVQVRPLEVPTPALGDPIRLTVQNRYEFTNLSELSLAYQLGEVRGELHPDIAPQQAGEVAIPLGHAANPGSHLLIRFVDRNGTVVDEENIVIGEEPKAVPVKKNLDKLQVRHMKELEELGIGWVSVAGTNFEVAFETQSDGGIVRLLSYGRPLLYETPNLHYLPIDEDVPRAQPLWTWKLTRPLALAYDGDDVVATAVGTYREARGNFVYRVTPRGEVDVHYDFTYLGAEISVREIGLRFGVAPWMDTLEWKRMGEWSVYPEGHIGRTQGRAQARAPMEHVVPPANAFSQDESVMGSNDFRSTKRNIEYASIVDRDGYGVYIRSNGQQHLRASVEADRIALHISDWFGGSAAAERNEWSPYGRGRVLKANERLQGTLHLWLLPGK